LGGFLVGWGNQFAQGSVVAENTPNYAGMRHPSAFRDVHKKFNLFINNKSLTNSKQ
jgi:hypothetical protein